MCQRHHFKAGMHLVLMPHEKTTASCEGIQDLPIDMPADIALEMDFEALAHKIKGLGLLL